MRKAGEVIVVWFVIFLVCALPTVGCLILLEAKDSQESVIANEDIIHWNLNMDSNATEQHMWKIEFDDFFPCDQSSYTVYPRFYIQGTHRNQNAMGSYELTISYLLNGVEYAGETTIVDWAVENSSLSWTGWSPSEGDLNKFSNATPKQSENTFEVILLAEVIISKEGNGEVEIQAGPLLLYAKKSANESSVFGVDPFVLLTIIGLLALPSAIAITYLVPKLSMSISSPSKVKRRR